MSFEARFEPPTDFHDEIDLSNCRNCPNRNGKCFNAGHCLWEDYE